MKLQRRRRFAIIGAALVITAMLLSLVITVSAKAAAAPEGLKSTISHMVISQSGDKLSIVQGAELTNNGAVASPELQIPLPSGAADFTAMSGNPTFKENQVVIPSVPAGGKVAVGFKYTLPGGQAAEIPFADVPPSDDSWVLIDEAKLSLDPTLLNQGFTDKGLEAMGPTAYHDYEVVRPAPGTVVAVKIKVGGNPDAAAKAVAAAQNTSGSAESKSSGGLLNKSFHGGTANVMLWQRMTGTSGHGGLPGIILIGLLLGGAIALIVMPIRRHAKQKLAEARARSQAAGPVQGSLTDLLREKDTLARRIAEMDKAAATAPSPELEAQRALQKRRLVSVLRRIRELENAGDD